MPPVRRFDELGRLVDVAPGLLVGDTPINLLCDCCKRARIRGVSIADVDARALRAGWRWLRRGRRRVACTTCLRFARVWARTAIALLEAA